MMDRKHFFKSLGLSAVAISLLINNEPKPEPKIIPIKSPSRQGITVLGPDPPNQRRLGWVIHEVHPNPDLLNDEDRKRYDKAEAEWRRIRKHHPERFLRVGE